MSSLNRAEQITAIHNQNHDKFLSNWLTRKKQTAQLVQIYEEIDPAKAARVSKCCQYTEKITRNDQTLYRNRDHCQTPGCLNCQLYNQNRRKKQFKPVIASIIAQHPEYKYIWLTINMQNCSFNELPEAFNDLREGLTKYFISGKHPGIGELMFIEPKVQGNSTIHLHVHILMAVLPSYFTHKYILAHEWQENVQKFFNRPVSLDIKKLKQTRPDQLEDEIMTKINYGSKPNEWPLNIDQFQIFADTLYKARLFRCTGIFAEIRKDVVIGREFTEVEEVYILHENELIEVLKNGWGTPTGDKHYLIN